MGPNMSNDDGLQFCPNCGQRITADDDFCPNCGYNLQEYRQESQTPEPNQPAPVTNSQKPVSRTKKKVRTKQQKRRRRETLLVVFAAILAIGSITYGEYYYSKASTLKRAVTAVKNNQSDLHDYFYTTDPNLKLTNATLQPLTKYFNQNPDKLLSFKTQLSGVGTFDNQKFSYQKDGQKFLIFPNWNIKVKPVYVTLTVNKKNAQIKENTTKIAVSNTTHFSKKIGPLVPGSYQLSSSANLNGHKLTNANTYHLNSNRTIPLTLKTVSFKVSGPAGTHVKINSKDQGKIGSSGVMAFKDFPWTQEMKVQGIFQNGKTSISSEPHVVSGSSDDHDISLVFKGQVSYDDADTLFTNLSEAMTSYSQSGDLDDATDDDGDDMSSFFVGGESSPYFGQFRHMGKSYYENDNLDGIDVSATVDSIKLSSENSSDVTYDMKYRFDTGGHYHIQVFRYTANVVKNSDDDNPVEIKSISTQYQKISDYDKAY
ncbi:zinc ribbon domain-containing protein [Lentilactobacillus kefiri]|nr:zinc ribbon domain-containing protein [Lentilactobacillus kefiri]MCJ2162356.1 zinc-ribbon domain-containing protein [Lentilactobacillus kefiri]MCP9369608.1 zinc-ribbon domain-containing protein [Lentilactobacillus kefiri]PAK59059.1 zinc ribbon domain-containing protein [Lentilactobacillus kefiri]PAK82092.1 zinc ribbon domain-containing protein [Lentilactobacillus kefiri]PAL05768.1 zinc ribbon domain-containing protein [Lentilactobacillus kefiri]